MTGSIKLQNNPYLIFDADGSPPEDADGISEFFYPSNQNGPFYLEKQLKAKRTGSRGKGNLKTVSPILDSVKLKPETFN